MTDQSLLPHYVRTSVPASKLPKASSDPGVRPILRSAGDARSHQDSPAVCRERRPLRSNPDRTGLARGSRPDVPAHRDDWAATHAEISSDTTTSFHTGATPDSVAVLGIHSGGNWRENVASSLPRWIQQQKSCRKTLVGGLLIGRQCNSSRRAIRL